MEIPICVTDAETFVDHIHDIKRLVYTHEQVEQLYQKSVEAKPQSQEALRPKSSGKQARKEYPAFDINPRLAREFLTRVKISKEKNTSEQHTFIWEQENHNNVTFQQVNEEYSSWKDAGSEAEEISEPVQDRPTTWAEALKRKQNLANGIAENQKGQKGPVKPKLVARTPGSETSPWKIKKDAPKISAKDVPGALRPLMSCALWRLQESIERNDSNQLFLLTDQPRIADVARKLNIIVRSIGELKSLIASKAEKVDLNTVGDLEREFGVLQKNGVEAAGSPPQDENMQHEVLGNKDDQPMEEKATIQSLTTGEDIVETANDSVKADKSKMQSEVQSEVLSRVSSRLEEISSADGDFIEKTLADIALGESAITPVENATPEKSLGSLEPALTTESKISSRHSETYSNGREEVGITSSNDNQVMLKIWQSRPDSGVKSATDPLTLITKSSSLDLNMPTQSSLHLQNNDHGVTSKAPHESAAPEQNQSGRVLNDPEDSDEEIVVFKPQPKRFSAQKQPATHDSRPSTPKGQPQPAPSGQSPKAPILKSQSKPGSQGRNTLIVSHGHPQPTNSPTIIDPDAFGRDFVVNPNHSPRALHNPRSHHRPRSLHIPQGLRRQDARASPPRPPSNHIPQNLFAEHKPEAENVASHSQHRSPRRSPQRLARPPRQDQPSSRDVAPRPSALEVRNSQDTSEGTNPKVVDVLPRIPPATVTSMDKLTQSTTNGSRVFNVTEFIPRSNMSETQAQISNMPRPNRVQPKEFVPRTPLPPPKQHTPEPEFYGREASMPDVKYYLKSGSSRAATRGRGRLWVP